MKTLNELILMYNGHIIVTGTILYVMVGDRIANIDISNDSNIDHDYIEPMYRAFLKAHLDGEIGFGEVMRPLAVDYTGSPAIDPKIDLLQKLWFALDQHRSYTIRLLSEQDKSLVAYKKALYNSASILTVGSVLEFEVQT